MDDPDNIFFSGNGKATLEEITEEAYPFGGPVPDMLTTMCVNRSQQSRLPTTACSGSYTDYSNNGAIASAQCTCTTSNGVDSTPVKITVITEVRTTSHRVCDTGNYPEHTLRVTQSNTTLCYSPDQLDANDTCVKTPSSPDYILPATSDDEKVCQTLPDGSRCPYTLSDDGNYLLPDYEANCYTGELPDYDDTQLGEADTDPNTACEDIGNGQFACIEDPQNVCDNFTCQDGCGIYEFGDSSEFICISQDTDEDNIPDYADPDIDGDGIANELDLDSDGDGVDDPDYGRGEAQPITVNVEFDDSGIISAIRAQTTTLDSTLNETNETLAAIEGHLTPTGDIDFTIPAEIQERTQLNDYGERNFGTVMKFALDRMSLSPLAQGVDRFFLVEFSGQCPVYRSYIPMLETEIVIDHFCTEAMLTIWTVVHAVMLVVFSFLAFRIAIL